MNKVTVYFCPGAAKVRIFAVGDRLDGHDVIAVGLSDERIDSEAGTVDRSDAIIKVDTANVRRVFRVCWTETSFDSDNHFVESRTYWLAEELHPDIYPELWEGFSTANEQERSCG